MRPNAQFDAAHPRCIYPVFGQQFDAAFRESSLSVADLSTKVGIREENIYGYRRGFQRPTATTAAKLTAVMGKSFDLTEEKTKPVNVLEDLKTMREQLASMLTQVDRMIRVQTA